MDDARARFLFGEPPVGVDLDDPDQRAGLLDADDVELSPAASVLRDAVANQIADEDLPQVWATAQRLTALGLDRQNVLAQLVMALAHSVWGMLADGQSFDPVRYASALDRLPLPTGEEFEAALLDVVRGRQGVGAEEADRLVLYRLGRAPDDEVAGELLVRVGEVLAGDGGPLAWLAGDRTVHVADLTAGVVLTHRLSQTERELGVLPVGFDLAGFARQDDLRLPDGALVTVYSDYCGEPGQVAWDGPAGWLSGFEAGSVLAVRVGSDGVVSVGPAPGLPVSDDPLVARVRRVYDREVDEPGMPVSAEDLLLGLLLEDRGTFSVPRPPLAQLCQAAGLERRGHEVAHDESIWANQAELHKIGRATERLQDDDAARAALAALAAADDPGGSAQQLRTAMAGLRDPDVLDFVADELLGCDDDTVRLDRTRGFSERLLAVARAPGDVAVARWLAAVVAERDGDARAADAHLGLAVAADASWPPAVDRAAWYASDKGDAVTAAQLWRRLGVDPQADRDLATVEQFALPAGPRLGRNERCWCGSGRKFKACHLNRQQLPPLPDRVAWLCRKAAGYLSRRGGAPLADLMSYARARAVDPDDPDSVADTLDDPIVRDAALVEGGWFDRFLADRGCLLPDDEAVLAAAWMLVPRTVYEVLGAAPGEGLTLQDLATGDKLDVRERSFSRQTHRGQVICARAVPDGETHQLVGSVFPVTPATETQLLELCEQRRGHELCDYLARQHRPPTLQTREGEPLVACTAVVEVPDPAAAREALDRCYQPEDGGWEELHEIDTNQRILRAQLRLNRDQLTVTTHSEPRLDRVLSTLSAAIPSLRVTTDTRVPLRPGKLPPVPAGIHPGDTVPDELVQQVQDMQERHWLGERIPALAGLTPVEAAADPTRVEQLQRLLASLPDPTDLPAGTITMRPDRLRELLALPPDGVPR
jgi:hypothetical protein